jgi:hypothetical protein
MLFIHALMLLRQCAAGFAVLYVAVIAYLHLRLEGVANRWSVLEREACQCRARAPIEFSCARPDDPLCEHNCRSIQEGQYPITYFNSLWLHIVTATTIGYGDLKVRDLLRSRFGAQT